MKFAILINHILFLTIFSVAAQPKYTSVKIGEKVPNIEFDNFINSSSLGGKMSLSDYKGKLIILDVWNKYCSVCISGFPKMQELQRKFGNRIQVLLVTSDKKEDYYRLLKRSKILQDIKLPFIFEDSIVNLLFPNSKFPLHIWIDSNRIVKAITQGYNATAENISKMLEGERPNMRMQQDDIFDFNSKVPIITEGNGRFLNKVESYSVFLKNLKDIALSSRSVLRDSVSGKRVGFKFINASLSLLFSTAYSKMGDDEIKLQFKGYKKFIHPVDPNELDDFFENFTFCYEFRVRSNPKDSLIILQRKMRSDLEEFFNIEARNIIQEERCYSLVNQQQNFQKYKPLDAMAQPVFERNKNKLLMQNSPIKNLLNYLQKTLHTTRDNIIPVINNTGYLGNITLDLSYDQTPSISTINSALQPFGLEIQEILCKREVLVLTDK